MIVYTPNRPCYFTKKIQKNSIGSRPLILDINVPRVVTKVFLLKLATDKDCWALAAGFVCLSCIPWKCKLCIFTYVLYTYRFIYIYIHMCTDICDTYLLFDTCIYSRYTWVDSLHEYYSSTSLCYLNVNWKAISSHKFILIICHMSCCNMDAHD